MTTYEIDINDGLAETLESDVVPAGIDVEQWLSLQVEQTISQAHIQNRQQELQRLAQARTASEPANE